MEEVVDCTAPSSPEELAIHFLLRHAACRMALTGQVDEDALQQALVHARTRQAATRQPAAAPRESALAPAGGAPVAGVTKDDSCAARFSRAYAAARHMPAPVDTAWKTRTAA